MAETNQSGRVETPIRLANLVIDDGFAQSSLFDGRSSTKTRNGTAIPSSEQPLLLSPWSTPFPADRYSRLPDAEHVLEGQSSPWRRPWERPATSGAGKPPLGVSPVAQVE